MAIWVYESEHNHGWVGVCTHIEVKLATLVEGDPKAPFSIATTPRWRGGRYSIPWMAVSSIIFKVFGLTQPEIEAWSPGPLDKHSTVSICSVYVLVYMDVCGDTKRIVDELWSPVKSLENWGADKIELGRVYFSCSF